MMRQLLTVLAILLAGFPAVADDPKRRHDHDADEAIAHPHDPVLQAEHMDMLHLVPHAQVTHQAARDGRWSDRTTWKDGKLPTANANVLVPRGTTVIVDREFAVPLRTVR